MTLHFEPEFKPFPPPVEGGYWILVGYGDGLRHEDRDTTFKTEEAAQAEADRRNAGA